MDLVQDIFGDSDSDSEEFYGFEEDDFETDNYGDRSNFLMNESVRILRPEDLLQELGIRACGTLRTNRKGFPAFLKDAQLRQQGDSAFAQSGNITVVSWRDKAKNKPVTVLSTVHEAVGDDTVQRRRKGPNGTMQTFETTEHRRQRHEPSVVPVTCSMVLKESAVVDELDLKHLTDFLGFKEQALKYGIGGFALKLFRLVKSTLGKCENFAIVTDAQWQLEAASLLMGERSSELNGICSLDKTLFVTDRSAGSIKIVTGLSVTVTFLENLGLLYDAFEIHCKGRTPERVSLQSVKEKIANVDSYVQGMVKKVKQRLKDSSATDGPQGTVSQKTVLSVSVKKGIERLCKNVVDINPQYEDVMAMETLLTNQVENLHAMSHS
ncbi:predicted protein [Nematostella vectensis]|uniref:PiggyBac transposable element-derived protein domain-containing protein n=1 Tax=Nematostella vectensis TaxID=45351 RepID=A7S811_NEMVE|nr:predicted protein [Nematostella vectensis]|eukprot:XP_001632234.1 predicted protein [Nematostella vectensis]